MSEQQQQRHREDDPRFTAGLIFDVHEVLKAHGYRLPEGERERARAIGATLPALLTLVEAFEGRSETAR